MLWSDWAVQVRDPVRACLERAGKKKILYIVFSYLTPFGLWNVPASELAGVYDGSEVGPGASADHYIADIYAQGQYLNPYYANADARGNGYPAFQSLRDYRASTGLDIYSVFRLDAASSALAKGLVDKVMVAERDGLRGKSCIDRNGGPIANQTAVTGMTIAEWNFHRTAEMSRNRGMVVVEDDNGAEFGTQPAPARCDGAALYAGWYSFDNYNDAFSWSPGAIGLHLDSASAADPRGGNNWSSNAIRKGISVTSGAIAEPYVHGLVRSDVAFRSLFQGATVGEAFLRAQATLRWQVINFGDPLYRPFPGARYPN
jgi:uncharacterized protein (TIGR03790 family)